MFQLLFRAAAAAAPRPTPRPTARRACLALTVLLVAPAVLAQTGTLQGQVVDAATGDPLIGAAVAVPGTGLGVATDLGGEYTLDLPVGDHTVRISYTGYVPVNRDVVVREGAPLVLNVGLEPDLTGLEEVVVTGALSERSVSRSEVAVSRINAEDLTDLTPYQDVSQLLNGKIAGVSVQPSSGNVGGGIRFNVRAGGGLNGDGQPLIFLDGVRIDNAEIEGYAVGGQGVGALSGLNPDDIASIDVLKGPAAAALYGTDASNGVVLITTKKGTIGGGPTASPFRVDYTGTYGQNSQQFSYDETTSGTTSEVANAVFEDGAIRQHTLALSGGSNTVRYFTQFDTRDEDGIVFGNFQDRRSLRGNFEAFPLPGLTVGVNASYGFNTVGQPVNDNSILGYLGNTILSPTPYAFTDSLAVRAQTSVYRTNRFLGSFDARYTPLPNLALHANVGLDASDARQDRTRPQNFQYSGVTNGQRSVYNRENDQVSFQLDGRYRYGVGPRLLLTSAVGLQGFDRRVQTVFFQVEDYATALITDIGAGSAYVSGGEFFNNLRQVGIIAEQSLEYDDTFFATVGVRNDYSSVLGTEAPSILYPTVRGALRLDRFAAVPALFSLLKVRAAYGESGQLPESFDGIPVLYSAEVGGDGAGATPESIGNPAIEPERVGEFEAGLDLEVASRVGLQATYYRQASRESIFDVPLAPSSGLVASNRPTNVGEIVGQGLEFALDATPVARRNVAVNLGVILNYATNEVKSVGVDSEGEPLPPLYDGFDINVIRPGLPRSAFYLPPVNGALFDADGVYLGVDTGVDSELHAAQIEAGTCSLEDDRCFLGVPYPEWSGSFSANVTLFRDLTIYALADWATGLSVHNGTRGLQARFGNNSERNRLADQLGIGSADDLPDLTPGTQEYTDAANAYARTLGTLDANLIEDADYLKLREVSVRYNLGRLISQAPGFDRVRTASLSVSARNLFTTTKYGGLDPEVNYAGARSLSRGQDFLTLQTPRVIYASLSLGF